MKNIVNPISIILRLTLGVALLFNGSQQMLMNKSNFLVEVLTHFTQHAHEIVYYTNLFQVILGLLIIFGAFTVFAAILSIIWSTILVISNPLFFANPLLGILQMNQVIAQIGVGMALFCVEAPILSLDHFFMPFKKNVAKNKEVTLEKVLTYSLAISFALSFASIFLFMNKANYVIFTQWQQLANFVPSLNLAIIGSFIAVAAVLLFFGYGKRQVGFGASILFLLALATNNASNFEVLPLLGIALSLAIMPKTKIKALKTIPRRKLEEL